MDWTHFEMSKSKELLKQTMGTCHKESGTGTKALPLAKSWTFWASK